jgi:hypothetical protein
MLAAPHRLPRPGAAAYAAEQAAAVAHLGDHALCAAGFAMNAWPNRSSGPTSVNAFPTTDRSAPSTSSRLATLSWLDWWNQDRLPGALGNVPPIEFEQHHYRQINTNSTRCWENGPSTEPRAFTSASRG